LAANFWRARRPEKQRCQESFSLFCVEKMPDISFVDFTSMVVLRDLGIQDVFTGDAHFQQVNLGFRLHP